MIEIGNKKEKWSDKSIEISEALKQWISLVKRNMDLQTSEERINLIKEIDQDNIILDYISSDGFKKNQIKLSKDWLSENDWTFCAKVSHLGYYIVHPNREDHGILSTFSKANVGRRWTNGKRISYIKTLTFSNIVGDDGEIFRGINVKNINTPTKNLHERLMTDEEPLWNIDLRVFDFSDQRHVKALLTNYENLKTMLVEHEDDDSEVWVLLELLDDLIKCCDFTQCELNIIKLIKNGLRANDIYPKFSRKFTRRQIKYIVNEKIPLRISTMFGASVQKVKNSTKTYMYGKTATEVNRNNKVKFLDNDVKKKNEERKITYKKFSSDSDVVTEVWSKEKIDTYLSEKYSC